MATTGSLLVWSADSNCRVARNVRGGLGTFPRVVIFSSRTEVSLILNLKIPRFVRSPHKEISLDLDQAKHTHTHTHTTPTRTEHAPLSPPRPETSHHRACPPVPRLPALRPPARRDRLTALYPPSTIWETAFEVSAPLGGKNRVFIEGFSFSSPGGRSVLNFLCFSERRVERAREFECWVQHFLPKDVLTSSHES